MGQHGCIWRDGGGMRTSGITNRGKNMSIEEIAVDLDVCLIYTMIDNSMGLNNSIMKNPAHIGSFTIKTTSNG